MASTLDKVVAKTNYLNALKSAIDEEMGRNPDMICLGEDIGILGGAFGVTEGLQAKYGAHRVMDMPISEAAIVGVSCGAALGGKTVMAEMQFIDFISCGFDQIVNMLATYHYRTAGEVAMNVVIRAFSYIFVLYTVYVDCTAAISCAGAAKTTARHIRWRPTPIID